MSIPAETVAFLTALYRRSGGYLTLSAIHPDRTQPTPSRHIPLDKIALLEKGLLDLLVANQAGWGAVFSVATRQADLGRWRRGGADDLLHLPGLFADIDHPPCEVLPRLWDYALPPSAIVLSGGGVHAYWWLSEPTTDWTWAARALRQLAVDLGGDSAHPAGALRLPGTLNTKPGRDKARCTLHTLNDHRYIKEDFIMPRLNRLPVRDPPRQRTTPLSTIRTLNPQLVNAVSARLLVDGGHLQNNGWIAALCPCGHAHDRPGAHFAFNPQLGVGVCHGRHGRLLLKDICTEIGIHPADYGGLYTKGL